MAIQHPGGTIVNTTFTGTDKTVLADGIKTALVDAGWTVASGSSGDWKLDSAITPQGLQMRVRVWNGVAAPTTANCVQIRITNVGETVAPAQSAFLFPQNKTWRVVANRYQAGVWIPGSQAAREFAMLGVPWTRGSVDAITEAGWLCGNAATDATSTVAESFRTTTVCRVFANFLNGSAAANSNLVDQSCPMLSGFRPPQGPALYRWSNGDYILYDALIGWSSLGPVTESRINGQLWGAFMDSADRSPDTSFTFDDGNGARDYIVVTANNTAVVRGTLCLAIS